MNKAAAVVLFGITLIFSGCGSNSSTTTANINGTWSAALSNSSSVNMFTFSTHLTGNADGTLGTTSFSLTLNSTPWVHIVGRERHVHAYREFQWPGIREISLCRDVHRRRGEYAYPGRHSERRADYRHLGRLGNDCELRRQRNVHHEPRASTDDAIGGQGRSLMRTSLGRPWSSPPRAASLTSIDAPARISLFS